MDPWLDLLLRMEKNVMKEMSAYLQKISSGWITLVVLLIFLLFMLLVLPAQAAEAELTAGDAGSPDTSIFYTPAQLYAMAQQYGAEGREAYIHARWTFDLLFPLVYGIFMITSIGWLSAHASSPGSILQLSNLLPVLGVLFDYLENISTSLVMARFPSELPWVALLATIFTLAKWVFIGAGFLVLLVLVLVAAIRWIGSRVS